MSQDKPVLSDFEKWLRTVCFQAPTPEAYDLAKCAWQAALDRQGWISVKERLPELHFETGRWMESARCIVFVEKTRFDRYEAFGRLTQYSGKNEWRVEGHNGGWHEFVTHWMPLPAAPETEVMR